MWKQTSLLLCATLLCAILLGACLSSVTQPGGPPVSPLIPNQVPVLLENQWRLTEIMQNGVRHDFDSIEPVLATFQPGLLALQACNAVSMFFDTRNIEDPNKYRLLSGISTARQCLDGGTEQEGILLEALRTTNRYEIEGDRLILSGPQVRVTFVIDNEAKKPPAWM